MHVCFTFIGSYPSAVLIYIYGTVHAKLAYHVFIYKVIKMIHFEIATSRTVNGIDFLFSTLHTTSFLSGKIIFGLLH